MKLLCVSVAMVLCNHLRHLSVIQTGRDLDELSMPDVFLAQPRGPEN